ncbi:MAG: hypothetical protein DRO36_05290 [Candidatus Hecatellales archaeon]|nr:MAG: hypothetical protein DRO36_05290 [Candidatus Hecatellales archaeon]
MFEEFSKEKLFDLLKAYARILQILDGFWFLTVEDKFGVDVATEIDRIAWENMASREAKILRETLGLKGENIETLTKTLENSPFMRIVKFEFEKKGENEAVLRIVECKPQMARVRSGRPVFPCKPVGLGYFKRFAETINPKIRVECLGCPPDPHPKEYWCAWRFRLEE